MSPFAYSNARVRSWKSELLDSAFLEKLLAAKDADAVTALLGQTNYQNDIERGVVKYKGVSGVEEGLRQNLTNTLKKLLKISADEPQAQYLVELILTKWDIFNLKTVLRGFHAGASEEEIFEQLIPVGVFDEAALRTLAKQANMKTVIGQLILLAPQYAASLITGYREYEKTNNLSNLELSLDKAYFKSVIERSNLENENAEVVNGMLRREIDLVNLMTLFRLTREILPDGTSINSYFIDGGSINVSRLIELTKVKEIKDLIEALKRTAYYSPLKKGFNNYQKTGSIAGIERALEDYNIQKNVALFRADPLSIATIVAYVWAKINEIINIRIIVRGKDVEMPADDIKEALVLV